MKHPICSLITRLGLLSAVFFALTAATTAQTPPNQLFQLDGNTTVDNNYNYSTCSYYPNVTTTCDDWDLLNGPPVKSGNSIVNTFVDGTKSTDSFTGGGSKDFNPLSKWHWSGSPTPDKDTLNGGYAALYHASGGDYELMFGANRASPNGDANIGIWFFKSAVGLNSDGTFSGSHINGDVFVISAFTGGGGNSNISVYQWDDNCSTGVKNPSDGQCADANLRLVHSQSSSVSCTGSSYCAVTNSSTVSSSWDGQFVSPTFFEGGMNLSAIFGSSLPCFSSVLFETRSSQSTSAVLKDFLPGSFSVCGMSITKACGTGLQAPQLVLNGTQVKFTWTGSVYNHGVGTLDNVEVDDTLPGDTTVTKPTLYLSDGSSTTTLAAGQTATYTVTKTLASLTAKNTATAKAFIGGITGPEVDADAPASATCTRDVSTLIKVTKSCVGPGPLLKCGDSGCVVQVPFKARVCNLSNVQLTNITLSDDPAANVTSLLPISVLNPVPPNATDTSNCADVLGKYQPTSFDLGNDGATDGRYTFTDTVSVTGATPALGPALNKISSGMCAGTLACAPVTCPLCNAGECTTTSLP